MGVIAVLQVFRGDGAGAAGAFGDVLAGHLDMDAARMRALGAMHLEEGLHFLEDAVEWSRLIAGRLDRVAMHRIGRPHHVSAFLLHRSYQLRQMLGDLVGAEARDQRQPAGLVLGIEQVDQLKQAVRRQRRTAFQAERVLDAAAIFDMRVIGLAGAITDPDHMAGGRVPIAGGRVDARQRLLVAQQQRLVAGVEIGLAQREVRLGGNAHRAHEIHRLGDAVGERLVFLALRAVGDEAQHPAMHVLQAGVAALREGAQKIERCCRLAVRHLLPRRIRDARRGVEFDAVDDVAAVARQRNAGLGLTVGRARLGELAGDAADLHHRLRAGESKHDRHLQKDAEVVANVVGAMFGQALRAVAALDQVGFAGGDRRQLFLQLARLTGKNQWRVGG